MQGSLKILYVVGNGRAASETFIRRELAALRRAGVQVLALAIYAERTAAGDNEEPMESVPSMASLRFWHELGRESLRKPWMREVIAEAWRLRRTERRGAMGVLRWGLVAVVMRGRVEAFAPRVLHAHFGSAPATVARLLARLTGVPWGVSLHASDIYRDPTRLDIKLVGASHVFACSEAAGDDVSRVGRVARPVVVHHGLDLSKFSYGGPPARGRTILAAGRFVAKKGYEHLLQACAVLAERRVAFELILVGAGSLRERLAAGVERLQLSQHVRILPWANETRMLELFSSARVLAVPSIVAEDGDRDNIPNVLVEALALGVPVVASELPGMSRLLKDENAALLVPPRDALALAEALETVLCDDTRVATMSVNGRRLAVRLFDERTNIARLKAALSASARDA